ncbi:MAG: hypothetical protein IPK85_03545 [Gemmatimonadetes bacterium]|jgi:hypothetical protein|nr:hypothetical protein [Gemmatimonadota bacterium]
MEIVVCVHVTTEASTPGAAGLWRWAVHIGRDFADSSTCLNAGVEDEQLAAEMRGQAVAVAAARVAERCGVLELTDLPTTVVLDHDPITEPWPIAKVEDF